MTLLEMKKKALALIEELNADSEYLTDDPDIAAKVTEVINQRMFQLARFKKIPKYVEIKVKKGDTLDLSSIGDACGYEVYQLGTVCGVSHIYKASGTVLKFLESGTVEIDLFVYPERITEKTKNNYEFELSPDVLEVMPYGVAADLLKSDVSAQYGKIYASEYESMLQMLDSRYALGSFCIEGGVRI